MKLIPFGDRIVVKKDESEEKTPGGIVLPDVAKKRPWRGEVLAVGEGKLLDDRTVKPMRVKSGQVVVFGAYAGHEVEIEGEKYLVMSEDDVIGTLG